MRVLVCEDETIIRLDICQLLETAGHTVVGEARDGSEAVRLAAELTPDIILMDVRMPELDGVEAARQILSDRQVPIVMVTAFAERDIVQQASEAGAFGYLVKPFRQDDVLAAITTAQARSAELAEARQEAKSLTEALETRKVVERAKGMLMTAENITEPDAYARMRSASQRTGQPMRAIAEALLATLSGQR
jgi:response regulator NasT